MESFNVENLVADLISIDYTAPLSAEEMAAVANIKNGIQAELGELPPVFAVGPPQPAPIAAAGFCAADLVGIDLAAPLRPEEAAAVAKIEAELRQEFGDLRPAVAQMAPHPLHVPIGARHAAFAPPPFPVHAPAAVPAYYAPAAAPAFPPYPAAQWYPQPAAAPAPAPLEPSPEGSVSPPLANGRHPKRPQNSYMLWARSRRAQVRAANPEIGNGGASKELGRLWRQESPDVVRYYEALAEEERRIHKEKYPNYDYHGNNKQKSKKPVAAGPLDGEPKPKRKRVAAAQDPPPQPAPAQMPPPPPKIFMLPRGGRMIFAEDDLLEEHPLFVDANGDPIQLIPIT